MNSPSFYLEGVVREKDELQNFEGPLSLILMLLSKNKIEIRDIKIAEILDQYLAYLGEMQSLDLEIASEFVQMASHLLYIKTKMLLSGDKEVSELELLMESLEQLKCRDSFAAIQKITPELKKASEFGVKYYTKQPEPIRSETQEYIYQHEPRELLRALYGIYSRGTKAPNVTGLRSAIPARIIFSVKDKSRELLERLRSGKMTLSGMYRSCRTRSELVATFMSVLELCSMGSICISNRNDDYLVEFIGGDIDEIIEKIVE